MLHVFKSPPEQLGNMFVIEAVENLPPYLTGAHDALQAQSAQLMRDGGRAHLEFLCQHADAHFVFDERGNDPHAAGVAESAEQVGESGGFKFGQGHDIVEYMNKRSYNIFKLRRRQGKVLYQIKIWFEGDFW